MLALLEQRQAYQLSRVSLPVLSSHVTNDQTKGGKQEEKNLYPTHIQFNLREPVSTSTWGFSIDIYKTRY